MSKYMTEEDIIEQEQHVCIPDYLYICLHRDSKIPNREQIDDSFKKILTVNDIEYDMNRNGIIYGIYVYFKYVNLKNFGDMLNKMKYGGGLFFLINFKNSIENKEHIYYVRTERTNVMELDSKFRFDYLNWKEYDIITIREFISKMGNLI